MSNAEATDPKYWANHLRNTVHFANLTSLLSANEGRIAMEVGPGKVLATLVKQQAAGKPFVAITGIEQSKTMTAYESVLRALGKLWLNGIDPDWQAFYSGQKRAKVNVPICL
jgi:acyl transferase domain-containing protein